MNEQQNSQPEENDKINKQFENTMKKLVAIVGGKENLSTKKKVGKDVLANVVNGLMQEKREATEKEVKEKLTELLSKKVEFDKLMNEKRAELDKLEKTKKKEYVDSANRLFQLIESLDELERDYYKSLSDTQS